MTLRYENKHLKGAGRCPQCGIAHPSLRVMWLSEPISMPTGMDVRIKWGVFQCTACLHLVLAEGNLSHDVDLKIVHRIYPGLTLVSDEVPERVRNYLQQAKDSLHAPDGATMLAGSAVDAMLKERGYKKGTLYARIKKAVDDHVLTSDMGQWAHQVRLDSNRPRHSDDDDPYVSKEDAKNAVEFASALATFLFVITARVRRGIEATSGSEGTGVTDS